MMNIVLKITAESTDNLKIVWGDGMTNFRPYHISRTQAENISNSLRSHLTELAKAYHNGRNDEYSSLLRKIAIEGQKLRFVLLDSNNVDINKIEHWLKNISQCPIMTIISDCSFHIPWSLVYDGELPAEGTYELDEYQSFWGMKFKVSTLYNLMSPKNLSGARPKKSFRLLAALNEKLHTKGLSYLSKDETEQLQKLLDQPVGSTFTKDDCKQYWEEVSTLGCLIYFFCHSNGQKLWLSNEQSIDVTEFKMIFRKNHLVDTSNSYSLVFLNGCSTAKGDLGNAFLDATSRAGFCGFIGSEVEIPVKLAIRFGLDFMQDFFQGGKRVYEIFHSLNIKHWPLGLLYGCYCHPYFHISSDEHERVA